MSTDSNAGGAWGEQKTMFSWLLISNPEIYYLKITMNGVIVRVDELEIIQLRDTSYCYWRAMNRDTNDEFMDNYSVLSHLIEACRSYAVICMCWKFISFAFCMQLLRHKITYFAHSKRDRSHDYGFDWCTNKFKFVMQLTGFHSFQF